MRKLLLGLAGVAALGLSTLAVGPAQAQSFSITVGPGYDHPHYRPYPVHRPYRAYDRPYYSRRVYHRPVSWYGRDCVVRVNRYWDGFGWVRERRRICR